MFNFPQIHVHFVRQVVFQNSVFTNVARFGSKIQNRVSIETWKFIFTNQKISWKWNMTKVLTPAFSRRFFLENSIVVYVYLTRFDFMEFSSFGFYGKSLTCFIYTRFSKRWSQNPLYVKIEAKPRTANRCRLLVYTVTPANGFFQKMYLI